MWVASSWVNLVWVPSFCVPSAPATAVACIAAPVASATYCTIVSLVFVCLLAIICICTLFAYVCLYETFTPDTMKRFLALMKITPTDAYMHIYCFCMNLRVSVFTCAHDYIYSDSAF